MTKKFTLLAILSFFVSAATYAKTFTVTVANYQFSPKVVNANVGDTIEWVWQSGFHTTTSTAVPAGAATWDESMNSGSTSFKYKLAVAGTYSYWCVPHAPNMAGTINATAVLPVSLTAFNILPSGKTATLKWSTASEQNTAYYTIKRSNDGSHFTDAGRVDAAGNSSSTKAYSFTDNLLPGGDRYLYYYLDIVDKDGAHTASAIQSFKNILAGNQLIKQVSPNPLTGGNCHLMLQFNADKSGAMTAKIYSIKGTLLKTEKLAAVEGLNNGHICLGTLAAGTYLLECTLDGRKETRKIMVQ